MKHWGAQERLMLKTACFSCVVVITWIVISVLKSDIFSHPVIYLNLKLLIYLSTMPT